MVSRTVLKVTPASDKVVVQGFNITEAEFQSLLDPVPQYTHLNGTWIITSEPGEDPLITAGKLFISYLHKKFNIHVDSQTTNNKVTCIWNNVPPGLGEPCFEKFQAVLCKELLNLPSAFSFEIGSGFEGTTMRGSEHNDLFIQQNDSLKPATNNAGGVLGGITNGNPVHFQVQLASLTPSTESLIRSISSIIILDFLTVQKVRKLLP